MSIRLASPEDILYWPELRYTCTRQEFEGNPSLAHSLPHEHQTFSKGDPIYHLAEEELRIRRSDTMEPSE